MPIMHTRAVILSLSFIFHSTSAIAFPQLEQQDVHNANHIFNAIHSSMRQWGSSLNHNGMSFFLATVPEGTQLYHGTWKSGSVKGIEWLAFEPEHALMFARPDPGPGRPGHPPPGDDESFDDWHGHLRRPDEHCGQGAEEFEDHARWPPPGYAPGSALDGNHPHPQHPHEPPSDEHAALPSGPPPPSQHPLIDSTDNNSSQIGYLHTYATKHALSLLYIDGMAAGKTHNGTLDSQDLLLLNLTLDDNAPMMGEFLRADGLCNMSSTLWNGTIDGFVRMELGFEIILCDFEKHLENRDIMAVDRRPRGGDGYGDGDGRKNKTEDENGAGWRFYRAVMDRYDGIGGGRVTLDYENFVTAFEHVGPELWDNDSESDMPMPRLTGVADADLLRMRHAVTDMVLASAKKRESEYRTLHSDRSVNWQAIADMLVTRYSTPLHALSDPFSPLTYSAESFADYLSSLLRPFIDHTARNTTLEISRCISQIVPPLPINPTLTPSLAHRATHFVAYSICNTLITAYDVTTIAISRSPSLLATTPFPPPTWALDYIDALVAYLQWTSWKQCGACSDDKLCIVPIWPMGTHEDHAHPSCRNMSTAAHRGGYWGYRQIGPPSKEPGKEPGGGEGEGVEGSLCPRPDESFECKEGASVE